MCQVLLKILTVFAVDPAYARLVPGIGCINRHHIPRELASWFAGRGLLILLRSVQRLFDGAIMGNGTQPQMRPALA